MGMCASKSSARSTAGSEKSDKCRWDKHGNVFFPVRRPSQSAQDTTQRVFMEKNSFATIMNPVYADFESPGRSRKGHFAGFAKLLKGSRGPVVEHKKHPVSPSRSRRSSYKELLVTKGFSRSQQSIGECNNNDNNAGGGQQQQQQRKRHGTLMKFIEAEKNAAAASLSRSSSSKEGSLTRSSSAKEAALSRCSSQKEGKREFAAEPVSDHLATIASLKATSFKNVSEEMPSVKSLEEVKPVTRAVEKIEASVKRSSSHEDVLPTTASFLSKGLGLPCYQPLVFRAGSPEKCRSRVSSTHSSLSSEDLSAAVPRRRSPNRKPSPGRKSPRKRSPNKKTGANSSGFTLNSSAARFQRSLPGGNTENRPTSVKSTSRPPQAPKSSTVKNRAYQENQENRTVLKEVQLNGVKSHPQLRRHSPVKAKAPPKKACTSTNSEKFRVYTDAIHMDIESSSEEVTTESALTGSGGEDDFSGLLKEPRSGSKRLRSPKKLTTEQQKFTKEYLNFNISLPAESNSVEVKSTSELPTKDKHIDKGTPAAADKVLDVNEDDAGNCSTEPELLELLERTPKKLKKMALKLALMIELEHSNENEDSCELVQGDQGNRDVDLELKLGKSKRRVGDGIRLDFRVEMDSPARAAGSASVPMTPRHSVSSTCNGLSVEARIGSSKGQSRSDFSFHILKNPDKLFGNVPQLHFSRTKQTEESSSSVFHVNASADEVAVEATTSSQTDEEHQHTVTSCTGNESQHPPSGESNEVQRCSSFGFENDSRIPRQVDDREAPGEVGDGERTPTKVHGKKDFDLNRCLDDEEEEASSGFEFKIKSELSNKSSPATPIMPTAPKSTQTDALSLSADEIAEIWGAFEACQEEIST